MDIKKIQGDQGLGTVNTQRKVNPYQESQSNASQNQVPTGSDTVQLSNMARQLSRLSPIIEEDNNQRKAKIDSIKARIENGSYQVDSKDVARSILSYASDNSGRA
ncbi:MAG TPA: flagellar biosynthesis anti-sigma factor FlgM [Oligoflexia bacterium]|nr:flagellar biosynthesis anti-sigma factor FlgM [Oligoflexia bacterium]HMP49782.1 flagellar biosynthesis anti-sigma factor FlgM [Oligoflexia bacterium]